MSRLTLPDVCFRPTRFIAAPSGGFGSDEQYYPRGAGATRYRTENGRILMRDDPS